MSIEQGTPQQNPIENTLLKPLSPIRLKVLKLLTAASFLTSAGSAPFIVKSHFDLNDARAKFNLTQEIPDAEALVAANKIISENSYRIDLAISEHDFQEINLLTSLDNQELYEAAEIVRWAEKYEKTYAADPDMNAARNLFGASVVIGMFSGLYGVMSALGLKVRLDLEKIQREILEKKRSAIK